MRFPRSERPDSAADGVVVPHARKRVDGLHFVRCVPAALLPTLHVVMRSLPEQTTARIHAEIPAFGGPGHDRLDQMIRDAVVVAADGFLGLATGDLGSQRRVEEHFRDLGRAEAAAGIDGQRVLAAIQVATETVWQAIQALVAREELSGHLVADLGVAVNRYLAHLSSEVQRGIAEQRHAMLDVRTRLAMALMKEPSEDHPGEVTELAATAGWPTPDLVVVVMAQLHGHVPGDLSGLAPDELIWIDGDRLAVVTVSERMSEVTEALLRLGPRVQVAQSWPVSVPRARHAYRWARRALALERKGHVQAEDRVVACLRYRTTLLLAADPALADEISQELLGPLHGVKPSRRLVLAETLLSWLKSDERAPALARRLGVHANTVRSHLVALHDLFGDRLHQPDQRTALILALEAKLPSWRAEVARRRRSRAGKRQALPPA